MKTAIPDDSKEFCRDINIPPLAPGEENYYSGLVRAEGNDRLYELDQFLNYLARFRNQDIIEEIDPRLHVPTIKKSKSLSELRKKSYIDSCNWRAGKLRKAWASFRKLKDSEAESLDHLNRLCFLIESIKIHNSLKSGFARNKKIERAIKRDCNKVREIYPFLKPKTRPFETIKKKRFRVETEKERITRLIKQLNVDKLENPYRDTPRIGMGLKSGYKPHRVSRNEVLVDEKTSNKLINERSILYAAGWALPRSDEDN